MYEVETWTNDTYWQIKFDDIANLNTWFSLKIFTSLENKQQSCDYGENVICYLFYQESSLVQISASHHIWKFKIQGVVMYIYPRRTL